MEIKRDLHLKKLIGRKQNGLIKVIIGILDVVNLIHEYF